MCNWGEISFGNKTPIKNRFHKIYRYWFNNVECVWDQRLSMEVLFVAPSGNQGINT